MSVNLTYPMSYTFVVSEIRSNSYYLFDDRPSTLVSGLHDFSTSMCVYICAHMHTCLKVVTVCFPENSPLAYAIILSRFEI